MQAGTRIRELVENIPDLAVLVEPLLVVRRVLRGQLVIQHRRLLATVRDGEVCRRLMTVPGVGPVVSLTYRATVDVPARFHKSKSVGAARRSLRNPTRCIGQAATGFYFLPFKVDETIGWLRVA